MSQRWARTGFGAPDPARVRATLRELPDRLRTAASTAPPSSPAATPLRLSILGLVVLSLFGALFARLWFLQVMNADEYQVAVEANITREVPEEAPRGRILDRNGRVIVDNAVARVVTLDPHLIDELSDDEADEVLLRLATELTGAGVPTKVADLTERIADPQYSRFQPVPVAIERAGQADRFAELEVVLAERATQFPGVSVERRWVRSYPYGRLASHILGYVGRISEDELAAKGPGGDAPGDPDKPYQLSSEIGKSGIEAVMEDQLRGTPGVRVIEVDVENEPVRTVSYTPPVRGNDVQLAIDIDLQTKAEQALREQLTYVRGKPSPEGLRQAPAGSVVAVDPRSGEVLAMASFPDYEPEEFVNGISARRYRELVGDTEADNPLINRAIQGQYAPGSTFKLITAYAALGAGMITGDTGFNDTGTYTIANCNGPACTRQNAGGRPNGGVTTRSALTVSSDTFFYWLGDRFWREREALGDAMQDAARAFGFHAPTGVDLPSERAGWIPDPENRAARHEENPDAFPNGEWYAGDNVNTSIGQGDVLVTPLQLANAYAVLAEGGTRYVPHLVVRVYGPADDPTLLGPVLVEVEPEVAGEVPMPEHVRDPLHDGLLGVASSQSPRGTAIGVFEGFDLVAFPIVSKTGTAQVTGKTDTSVFVAYGPDPSATISVAAILEESGFGSQAAAPVVRRLLEQYTGQPDSSPESIAAADSPDPED